MIQPEAGAVSTGSYSAYRINLSFTGDFYGLSDFLYRLRSLVVVHHGQLEATGRLFNVEQISFSAAGKSFPQISATLAVDAYVYGAAPTPPPAPPTTSTDSTSTDTTSTDATAAAATG
jgi:hypothetical protein